MAATPIDNQQPYLSLTNLIMINGSFPSQPDGTPGDGEYTIGMMRLFAGNFAWAGTAKAEGQLISISQESALFVVLGGATYGGNNQSNFALPDLRGDITVGLGQGAGLDPVTFATPFGSDSFTLTASQLPAAQGGGGQPADNHETSLGLHYLVRVHGTPNSNLMIGGIVRYAGYTGNYVPEGFIVADGSVLLIADHPLLFAEYGTMYGGNGVTTFGIPDLRGRAVVGASADHAVGETFGDEDITVATANLPASAGGSGTPIGNEQPSIALTYIIAVEGIYPSSGSGGYGLEPSLGEIQIWGGSPGDIPDGWRIADGSLLTISQHSAMFSLLGTTYGGNGQTNFALPDLRGRVPMGADSTHPLGAKGGSVTQTIDGFELPDMAPIGVNDDSGSDAVVERGDGTATGNVLANDADINGGTKTVTGVRTGLESAGGAVAALAPVKGVYGTLTLNADGSYSYVLDNADPDTKALPAGLVVGEFFTYRVTDDTGLADTAQLAIAVTGADDAPVLAGPAAIEIGENAIAVTTVAAADPDDTPLSYTIMGGADAGRFALDPATGALTFLSAPDYETPGDADGNNVYELLVRASDGVHADEQALAITILDRPGNTIRGTSGADRINPNVGLRGKTATDDDDTLLGRDGSDTLNGGFGNDTLTGGAGSDKFTFTKALGPGNVDIITDFRHNTDKVRLDETVFTEMGGFLSSQEFYARRGAVEAHDRTDRIVYDSRSGKLYYDHDGKGGDAAIHFATLSSKPVLDHGDFVIV